MTQPDPDPSPARSLAEGMERLEWEHIKGDSNAEMRQWYRSAGGLMPSEFKDPAPYEYWTARAEIAAGYVDFHIQQQDGRFCGTLDIEGGSVVSTPIFEDDVEVLKRRLEDNLHHLRRALG